MRILRYVRAVGMCLATLACGSSEPPSPLILGSEATEAAPGPRTLTSSQERALQDVIASAGERCDGIDQAYLRDFVAGDSEAWDVRCSDGAYSVLIAADGRPAAVRPCFSRYDDSPCFQPFRVYPRERAGRGGALNPDLGKLLEPMTAKDGKTD